MTDAVPMNELGEWIKRENFQAPKVHIRDPEYHKGGMLSKAYLDFLFVTTYPSGETITARHRFSEVEVSKRIEDRR